VFFHYVMYEAEESPETAPTLVWYNGGPGSPSTFGMFQELGPLYVNVDSEKTAGYVKCGGAVAVSAGVFVMFVLCGTPISATRQRDLDHATRVLRRRRCGKRAINPPSPSARLSSPGWNKLEAKHPEASAPIEVTVQ